MNPGLFKEITRGRFKDHPIHTMFVHFPIGLFTAGFCFDLAAYWIGENLSFVAFYCIAGGLAGGLLAMVFGFVDYLNLAEDEQLFRKAGKHAILQITSFFLFLTVFGIKLPEYPDLAEPSILILILETVAILAMLSGNHIGGDLVYKHGVGTSIR